MGRSSRLLLAAVMVGALTAGISLAGIPDPDLSTVPNIITSPAGSLDYTITVVGTDGPIDAADVQIVVGTEADGIICWCTTQVHPTISGTTGASGTVTFNIEAGGCIDSALAASPPVAQVFANGILIGEPGIASTDAVDGAGILAQDGWNPDGTCATATGDAVFFTPFIVNNTTGPASFCADFNSDGETSTVDAVIVTPDIVNAASCTQAP